MNPRAGWFVVALLVAVVTGVATATGYSLLWKTMYFLLVLIGLSGLWAWLNIRNVAVERSAAESRAQIGQVIQERITVRNTSPIPKPWLEIRDNSDLPGHQASQVIYLGGHGSRSWKVQTTCTRRGRFQIGPITLGSTDPAGLFRQERQLENVGSILVYPKTVPLPDFVIPGGELSGESRIKTRTHAVTPNAAGIRDYAPGDALSRIHWLSSARTGRMMVKEFELDPSSEVWLLVDMDALVQAGEDLENTEELAVVAAASIARRMVDINRSVGLIAYGGHHEVVVTDRGDRQIQKLLESLALIRATGSFPLAEVIAAEATRFGRNTTLIAITPSTDPAWVDSLSHQTHRGVRAVAIVVDPASFGAGGDISPVRVALAAADIRSYIIGRDDPLDVVLSSKARSAGRAA